MQIIEQMKGWFDLQILAKLAFYGTKLFFAQKGMLKSVCSNSYFHTITVSKKEKKGKFTELHIF